MERHPLKIERVDPPDGSVSYEPFRLPDERDWLWRPFMRGRLTMTEMRNPAVVDLCMIATVNELLDVEDENNTRLEVARARK